MARVALVTGGTRGIGGAISRALKDDGYRVAANYRANGEAAGRFGAATGVGVYKWDVCDFAACEGGGCPGSSGSSARSTSWSTMPGSRATARFRG